MYRIVLVDDESGQLEIMKSIILDICPQFDVKTFDNSIKALEFINKNDTDAVISDIKMPVMDGLKLTEQISKIKPDIVIAIISAYSDFEYAQTAINYGVVGYLIKPVSISKLKELMEKIEHQLILKAESLDKIKDLNRQLESYRPVYIEKQLKDWLMGNTGDENFDLINSVFQDSGYGLVAACKLMLPYEYSVNSLDSSQLISFYKAQMRKLFSSKASVLSVIYDEHHMILVSVIGSMENIPLDFVIPCIDKQVKCVKSEFNVSITFGISEITDNITNKLQTFLKQALQALDCNFLITTETCLYYGKVKTLKTIGDPSLYMLENKVMDRFRSGSIEGIKEQLEIFCETYSKGDFIAPSSLLHEHYLHIALSAKRHIQYNINDDIIDRMNCANSIVNLTEVLLSYLTELIEYQKVKSDASTSDVLESIKNYINKNFHKDISLELIAENFHFNPSYISLLFKTQYNTGFKEYLIKMRIEEARCLLNNTNLKVYEIAQKIGYSDVAYFVKLFKKEVGISPNKFRCKTD